MLAGCRGAAAARPVWEGDPPPRRTAPALCASPHPPSALLRHPPSAPFSSALAARSFLDLPTCAVSPSQTTRRSVRSSLSPAARSPPSGSGRSFKAPPSPLHPPKPCPPLLLNLPWRHHVWPQPCCEAVRAGVCSLPCGGVAGGWHGGWTARGTPRGSVWRCGAAAVVGQPQQCSSGFTLLTFPSPFFLSLLGREPAVALWSTA